MLAFKEKHEKYFSTLKIKIFLHFGGLLRKNLRYITGNIEEYRKRRGWQMKHSYALSLGHFILAPLAMHKENLQARAVQFKCAK